MPAEVARRPARLGRRVCRPETAVECLEDEVRTQHVDDLLGNRATLEDFDDRVQFVVARSGNGHHRILAHGDGRIQGGVLFAQPNQQDAFRVIGLGDENRRRTAIMTTKRKIASDFFLWRATARQRSDNPGFEILSAIKSPHATVN